jgi:hypothetical protein
VRITARSKGTIDRKCLDRQMLALLVKELSDKSGFEFEKFVTELLIKKYGPTKWPPRNGSDGKIDFASKDFLFQIYGSEKKRGSIEYVRRKLYEVRNMKETAKESRLTAKKVVLLTNIHPDKEMAKLILSSRKNRIPIKDVYQTAEFLYDVYYPFDQLALYCEKKCDTFSKENWPYDIDERTFVESFDFLYGKVLSRYAKSDKKIECLSFISESILHGPVICAGYYGMGKTVISKMLFKRWDSSQSSIYPVYIALTHRRLRNFSDEELYRHIVREVKSQVFEPNLHCAKIGCVEVFDGESFAKSIQEMVENRKILLIFDGIDESASEREELLGFLNFIFTKNFLVFLTCRLEYRPFFDSYQALRTDTKSHTYIELCEWEMPQWNVYVDGLFSIYSSKKELISQFSEKLNAGIYSTLPGRPLFLKMLSDLEINNETGISILPELSSNLAEIYYKFIKWKIRDDYNRKGGVVYDFDLKQFEKECFNLLRQVAFLEYQSTLENKESQVTLRSILGICADEKFIELSEEYVSRILLKSSLFAILRRTGDDAFIFSHKSFMEYLVAFSLAYSLFPEDMNPSNATCDEIWHCFQTHEISRHFVNEIERVQTTLRLSPEKSKEFISNAFSRVVNEQLGGNLMNYDERFQEILYYIGKLKVRSPELVRILQQIVANRDKYNPVYFRSASLALSRIMGDEYCERYVLHLINDLKDKKSDFKLNQKIQIRYYGEATLRRILKEDIDDYISARNSSSIISLKILTYFTVIPPTLENEASLKDYLDRVYEAAIEQEHISIQTICKAVSKMLDTQKISG